MWENEKKLWGDLASAKLRAPKMHQNSVKRYGNERNKKILHRLLERKVGLRMSYQYLDMNSYKRKSHFDYFCSLAYPYVGTTVNIDITGLVKMVKKQKLPFFLTFCYCVSKAANCIPQFRQRIIENQIIEFDHCKTSHTVLLEDETYCYCTLESNMPFSDFLPYAVAAQENAKQQQNAEKEKEVFNDKIYISTLPWFSYTSLIQPVPMPADSNPRITWSKYFMQNENVFIPVSVLCHHALVDGLHIAKFYQLLGKIVLFDHGQEEPA